MYTPGRALSIYLNLSASPYCISHSLWLTCRLGRSGIYYSMILFNNVAMICCNDYTYCRYSLVPAPFNISVKTAETSAIRVG